MGNIIKQLLFSISFLFPLNRTFSQDLILNGDFEDINICSEFLAPCAPQAWRLTSTNLPLFGEGKVGFIVFNSSVPNIRSYLQSRLIDTLILGEEYKLSLDIKPGSSYINEIGVKLSDSIILTKSDILLRIDPDFEFIDNKSLLQHKNGKLWLHLEKNFIANSKALYIIIGNFYSDNELIKKNLKGEVGQYENIYYYVDKVKLESINNLHSMTNKGLVKDLIYAQHQRHPVPDSLFVLKAKDFTNRIETYQKTYKTTDTVLLYNDLLFAFNSYEASESLTEKIDSIFINLRGSIESIEVIGHTDNIGSNQYNQKLSLKRAQTVATYILSIFNLPEEKIKYSGVGSSNPIFSNETESERYKNRRVEIIINYK
jgi:outer membrane protein OmpA-like peptidoglycan-associated protein